MQVSKNDIEHIITASPDVIERVLKVAQAKIDQHRNRRKEESSQSNILREKEESFKMMYARCEVAPTIRKSRIL
ncbi:MAG: hypothetical protein JST59_00190 [Actinobacteria bacterium]|nr:hypothetical protein [Actinomycetota bacterium]